MVWDFLESVPSIFGGAVQDVVQAVTPGGGSSQINQAIAIQNVTQGRYPAEVERWRSEVERIFKEVGGNAYTPQDVDKALWVIFFESKGNPDIYGDGGHAIGLFQHNDGGLASGRSLEALKNPQANIRLAAEAIYGGQGWGPWGEGRLYQGKIFGALGNHPYQGYTDAEGNPVNVTAVEGTGTGADTNANYDIDSNGFPSLTYRDFLARANGDHYTATQDWTAYQQAKQASRAQDINEVMSYLDIIGSEISLDIQNKNLSLNQAVAEFEKRLSAFTAGHNALANMIPFTIPKDANGQLFGFGQGSIGQRLGMAAPTPSATIPNPLLAAQELVSSSPNFTGIGTADVSGLAGADQLFLQALNLARTQNNGLQNWPPPGGAYPGSAGPEWVGRGAG